jgi:hypothetical protein
MSREISLLDRAAFQILMSARVHASHGGMDYDADKILALAQKQLLYQWDTPVDYVVVWRALSLPKNSPSASIGVRLTVWNGKKKQTYFKDYAEEE